MRKLWRRGRSAKWFDMAENLLEVVDTDTTLDEDIMKAFKKRKIRIISYQVRAGKDNFVWTITGKHRKVKIVEKGK